MCSPNPASASPWAARREQAKFKVLWEDEMKAVNKYVHYKKVVALLLYWENVEGWSDMKTESEVNTLADVLKNVYNFHVEKRFFRPSGKFVQTQMNKFLSDFLDEFDDEQDDALLIIYYAGHGWALPGGRGELQLAGHNITDLTEKEQRRLSIHWNESEPILHKTHSDILLILDCCDSGTLAHRGRPGGRRYQLLAACEHDKTTPFPGKFSFTSALIWALKDLANENPFSTCKLRLKIAEEAPHFSGLRDQTPLLHPQLPASNSWNADEHIMLEVLGQEVKDTEESLGVSAADEENGGDYVDLRFHFAGPFRENELRMAAKEMKAIMRHEKLALRRVGFLKQGNVSHVVHQAVTALLDIHRRKQSIASPLTPTTQVALLQVPQPTLQTNLSTDPTIQRIVTTLPRQPSVSSTGDEEDDEGAEESPLLPLAAEAQNSNKHQNSSSIQYHLVKLLRRIWHKCVGWLNKGQLKVRFPQLVRLLDE